MSSMSSVVRPTLGTTVWSSAGSAGRPRPEGRVDPSKQRIGQLAVREDLVLPDTPTELDQWYIDVKEQQRPLHSTGSVSLYTVRGQRDALAGSCRLLLWSATKFS